MIIVSQDNDILVNSENVFSFFADEDPTNAYLAVSYNIDTPSVVLGRYSTLKEAKKELQSLFNVLVSEKRTCATSYQIR